MVFKVTAYFLPCSIEYRRAEWRNAPISDQSLALILVCVIQRTFSNGWSTKTTKGSKVTVESQKPSQEEINYATKFGDQQDGLL